MQKIKILLFMFITTFIISFTVNGQSNIGLYVDGVRVNTDVQPVVINERVLVPVRGVFEQLNADVSWIDSTQQVIVKTISSRVVLSLNSTEAFVDGQQVFMDAAPTVINNRTLIPVRFVSESLGYNVEWNANNNSVYIYSPSFASAISDISYTTVSDSITFNINGNKIPEPKVSYAMQPLRFIADFYGTDFSCGDGKISVNSNGVKEIRWAKHDSYSRIVIEATEDVKFSSYGSESYFNIQVSYTNDSLVQEGSNSTEKYWTSDNAPLIVIDPGHGGWDPGATAYDENGNVLLEEADANLRIATTVYNRLVNAGANVVLTRTSDVGCADTELNELKYRCQLANDMEADLFVSIHNNSFSNTDANGTEVLYVEGGSENSFGISGQELAQNIQTTLVTNTGLYDRGIKNSSSIYVLMKTKMPAVVVECAFVSNASDCSLLLDHEFCKKAGNAIADGILNSFDEE